MTPAAARTFMLYLLLGWLVVLAGQLTLHGVRRLRGAGGTARGGLEVAAGLAALACLGWVLT